MAFETGVSTSPSNLLSLLQTRLSTDGWTIVRANGLAETGSSLQLSVSDPGIAEGNQYNMVAFDTGTAPRWAIQPSTGDGGAGVNFYNHTGSPNSSGSVGTSLLFGNTDLSTTDQGFGGASIAYFFFSGTTPSGARYCHVVLEGTAGVYFHFAFGTVEKAGTFTGGQYATATSVQHNNFDQVWPFQFLQDVSRSQCYVRGDSLLSAGSPGWRRLQAFAHALNSGALPLRFLYYGGLDTSTQRTPFAPMLIPFWSLDIPSLSTTSSIILGHVPDIMLVSMDGREPGAILTLGSDDWYIFPAHFKTQVNSSVSYTSSVTGGTPANTSNLAGYAYRKP